MVSPAIQKLSLSNEEIALVYSLLNLPQVGKSLLFDAYGKLSNERLEEKLITASHTLLARGAVHFSEKGLVRLNPEFEKVFYPLVQYKNMVQVLINNGEEDGLTVTDYYIGKAGFFTSNEIDLGVIHHIFSGKVQDLKDLVLTRMRLPDVVPSQFESALQKTKHQLKLSEYANLEDKPSTKAISDSLRSKGFDPLVCEAFAIDIHNPTFRGSASVININSDKAHSRAVEETGQGFLWLTGKQSSWLMVYDHGNDNTVVTVQAGTGKQGGQLLHDMISRIC